MDGCHPQIDLVDIREHLQQVDTVYLMCNVDTSQKQKNNKVFCIVFIYVNQNMCIYIQTKDTHELHYGGFTWGEKEVVGIKEKGEKRHIPREAANVGILKDQRMNLSGQKRQVSTSSRMFKRSGHQK